MATSLRTYMGYAQVCATLLVYVHCLLSTGPGSVPLPGFEPLPPLLLLLLTATHTKVQLVKDAVAHRSKPPCSVYALKPKPAQDETTEAIVTYKSGRSN
eukprot:1134132-Pelagomonas_calceolata.AAC.1